MHSAVLQNKSYITFANENTVEVLSLGRLDEAVTKKDPKAATYKAKDSTGAEVEYMVNWPGLTFADILALDKSPAGRYNDTGSIPQIYVVDPHTLKKMDVGEIVRSAKGIQDAVLTARQQLDKEHGKGFPRKEHRKLTDAIAKAEALAAEGEYSKALQDFRKVTGKVKNLPQALQESIDAFEGTVVAAAKARVEELEAKSTTEPVVAKRELIRLQSRLRGTGLEKQVDELIRSIK